MLATKSLIENVGNAMVGLCLNTFCSDGRGRRRALTSDIMGRSQSYKEIELRQLRSFALAATEGNFSAVAAALGISVTTVWEQVRALERKLGTTLLHRHGRTLELTEQGRLLFQLIQPHVSGLDSLERIFQSQVKDLPLQLHIAATQYLMATHLPGSIQEFTTRHPTVRLKLFVDPSPEAVAQMVETRQADLGVLVTDWEHPESPHLAYELLFDLELMLLTAVDHPLARKKQTKPADLVQHPIITMPDPSLNRRVLDRILRENHLSDRAHVLMEAGSYHLIFEYVERGIGIALLYLPPAERQIRRRVLVRPFRADQASPGVAIAVRKHAHLPPHVREFRDIIRGALSTHS